MRYLCSQGKWKVFLDMEDFHEIFNFGIDFVERMYEIIYIPFWKDVLGSLKISLKSDTCTMLHHVCTTPLWYNNLLKLPLKHKWLKKGVITIGVVLTEDCRIMSIEIFQETFNIKTNFLEYGGLILTIKNFMDNLEKPSSNLVRPANSLLNIVLNKDISGVSNLYKSIHRKNSNIIQNICTKWYTKSGIILLPYDIKRSFIVTNKQIDDAYIRYTQFRTLHYRYFTNDLLVKCKIQTDDMCSICLIAKDSNYHMLLDCIYTQRLWIEVELFFPGRWHSVRDYRVIL